MLLKKITIEEYNIIASKLITKYGSDTYTTKYLPQVGYFIDNKANIKHEYRLIPVEWIWFKIFN